MDNNSDKRRLAKNTILLYGRTIIVMFVSLYVSRLILNILGVSNYGVYNAVGGMVGMFALVSGSLVAATQRYISFELGKKEGKPSYVFSLSMGLHLLIALFVFLLAETVGVWFLNKYMNIPPDCMVAANWVFQFSVLAFILQLVTIPYNAIVVAQERMGFFAIICIVEVFLKLFFAIILLYYFSDKLVYYSVSMALVPALSLILYLSYCRSRFKSFCVLKLETNLSAYKQMGGFIGWNFLGSTATVLSKQGINVLLNIFFGIIVNAGRGVAVQVDNAVNQFINSFTTALRPQITKTYAAQELNKCFNLVNQGTKMIIYLTLLFIIPLSFRAEYVLTIWLKIVPGYAVLFTRLSFLTITMDALSTPLYYLMLATGRIRTYQIVAGTLALLVFPLTWAALKLGLPPEISYYILFVSNIIRWMFQLVFLKRIAHFKIKNYIKLSVLPILEVTIITVVCGIVFNNIIPNTIWGLVFLISVTTLSLGISILLLGLSKSDKTGIINNIIRINKLSKIYETKR